MILGTIMRTSDGLFRSRGIIVRDLKRIGVSAGWTYLRRLERYPYSAYSSLIHNLEVLVTVRSKKIRDIKLDSFSRVERVDFGQVDPDFLSSCISGATLDLTDLGLKLALYRRDSVSAPKINVVLPPPVPDHERLSMKKLPELEPTDLLTGDLLYNSTGNTMFGNEYPFPANLMEYSAMMYRITGGGASPFPGDQAAISSYSSHFRSLAGEGVQILPLRRGGYQFNVLFFTPRDHAPHMKNRIAFDLDILSQVADFRTYGILGSWPREAYHDRRWLTSDVMAMALLVDSRGNDMPVAFTAVSPFEAVFEGRQVTCAFIHAAMTRYKFQGIGLSSFLMRQAIGSIWWDNVFNDEGKNIYVNRRSGLTSKRWWMWVLSHSGRFPIYRLAENSFIHLQLAGERDRGLRNAIVEAGDSLITAGRRGDRPLVAVGPHHWRDERVYEKKNRPLNENGEAIILQREVDKAPEMFERYLEAIGGRAGIENGNSLFHLYPFTPWVSLSTKMTEWEREWRLWKKRIGERGIRGMAGVI